MRKYHSTKAVFPDAPTRLFFPHAFGETKFPINRIEIDWNRLIEQRVKVLKEIEGMPPYLLYPEVMALLKQERNLTYRLIIDLMWTTGALSSEVLALKPTNLNLSERAGVILRPLKRKAGRPTKRQQDRYYERYVPITDPALLDNIQCYLNQHQCRNDRRIFTMCQQTINRHIHKLVEEVGGAPFNITAYTFRHSFAIHLILHGRPLKSVCKLLGVKFNTNRDIYTNVLMVDERQLLNGVDFH